MTAGPSSPSGPRASNNRSGRIVSSIAVALATAICLFPQLHGAVASTLVLLLAIAGLVLARDRILAAAALFLIGVAAIDLVTFVAAARVSRNFAQSSASHVNNEMQRVRREIVGIESELQASADHVGAAIAAQPGMLRPQMFHLLELQPRAAGRGMRIVGANGTVLAWWGDELRVTGDLTYQFDVTNLYITRSRPLSRDI